MQLITSDSLNGTYGICVIVIMRESNYAERTLASVRLDHVTGYQFRFWFMVVRHATDLRFSHVRWSGRANFSVTPTGVARIFQWASVPEGKRRGQSMGRLGTKAMLKGRQRGCDSSAWRFFLPSSYYKKRGFTQWCRLSVRSFVCLFVCRLLFT